MTTATAPAAPNQARRQGLWYQLVRRTVYPLMFVLFVGPYVYFASRWYGTANISQMMGQTYFSPPVWAIHWGVTGTIIFCLIYEKLMPYKPQKLEKGEFLTDALHYFLRVHGHLLQFAVLGLGWLTVTTFNVPLQLPEPWLPQVHTYMPYWLAVIMVCIVAEFPDYWAHRALHAVPFLWRVHAVHHSSHHMYTLMTIRAHPLDYMFKQFCMYSVLYMCGFSVPLIAVWMLVRSYSAIMAHSNADYWNPWLNYIFNTNHLHSWHHSTKASECECNFGVGVMLWDQIFGTYYNPAKDTRPKKYGLFKEHSFPINSFFQQLIAPFMWKRYMGSAKTKLPKSDITR